MYLKNELLIIFKTVLKEDEVNLIYSFLEEDMARQIQKHATHMIRRNVLRLERINIRFFEKSNGRPEPVAIINNRWVWKFNKFEKYRWRLQFLTTSALIKKLPFKNPPVRFWKEYTIREQRRRNLPPIGFHRYM